MQTRHSFLHLLFHSPGGMAQLRLHHPKKFTGGIGRSQFDFLRNERGFLVEGDIGETMQNRSGTQTAAPLNKKTPASLIFF